MESAPGLDVAAIDGRELAGVVRKFQQWRSTRRKASERIPEALWQAAASLYPRFSVCQIARALRLDFVDLRDRIHPERKGNSKRNRKGTTESRPGIEGLQFMELPAAGASGPSKCRVNMKDGRRGKRITIRIKGVGTGQILQVLQPLWSRPR